jgi:SAM-dependent methyltransferase
MDASAKKLGRELLGGRDSLAVEAYRERLLSGLALPEGRGRKVLDLGCGDGLEALYFLRRGYNVEAHDLEPHPRWKELERRFKGRLRFQLSDAAKLGRLKAASYDLVFEKDMLHHVDKPVEVLRQMGRLLKKGGSAHVVECNRYNPIFYLHLTLWGGHQHFSRSRLKALLAEAGIASYTLRLREARVWPIESAWFQKAMDFCQKSIERSHLLDPWLCYHLVRWEKR